MLPVLPILLAAKTGLDIIGALGQMFQGEPSWRDQMQPMPTRNVIPELEANSVAHRLAQRYGRG